MSTFLVRKDGSGTHTTIQSAIYSSVDGDVIDIGPGTFEENIELYKSITLQGAGKDITVIQGNASPIAVSGASFFAGENIVTVSSTSSLIVGRRVTGTNITANSRIDEILSDTQIRLSLNTSTTGIVAKTIVTLTSGNSTITLPNTTSVAVGMKVVGVGVDATITALNTTTKVATLSSPVTQSGSNVSLSFKPLRSNVTLTMPIHFSGSTFPATIQVMNVATNGLIVKNMTVIGFDGIASVETTGIGMTSPGTGVHANWLIDNCRITANGDSAFVTSPNLKSENGTIQNCIFDGKTFVGSEPAEVPAYSSFSRTGVITAITASTFSVQYENMSAIVVGGTATSMFHAATATITSILGNVATYNKTSTATVGQEITMTITNVQFSIPNVSRQLVVIGNSSSVTACINTTFKGNTVSGQTGAIIAATLNKSMFNCAVTVDTVGGLIEDNVIIGNFGSGLPNTTGSNFAIRSRRPDGALQQTIIRNNTNDQRGGRKNIGFYFAGDSVVASNNVDLADNPLVVPEQLNSGSPMKFTMEKSEIKSISKVSLSPVFSDESNWNLVSYVFKKVGSSKRIVCSFRDFVSPKEVSLKAGMLSGEQYELAKIIISKSDRSLMVIKRNELANPSSYDFILK
jgi:hypothetical protein